MSFVYEQLDGKALAELEAKVAKFQTVLSMTPMQVIDRARDLVFASLGGRGELPPGTGEPASFFVLLWKGQGVILEGHHKSEYPGSVLRATIHLTRYAVPNQLRDSEAEIRLAIEEAMKTYWATRTRLPLELTLHFPRPAYY